MKVRELKAILARASDEASVAYVGSEADVKLLADSDYQILEINEVRVKLGATSADDRLEFSSGPIA